MIGFVQSVDNGIFSVLQIDDYGSPDGVSYARLEDVTGISCNGEEERRLAVLAQAVK